MLIRDPLYGDIRLSKVEESIVNTKSFNRLRNIKQLAFSEYVYPGATHNRYSHSIGVLEIATRIFNVIQSKTGILSMEDLSTLRQVALCHDLGHSPFSHSSEVLSDITHEDRMYDILNHEQENISEKVDIALLDKVYCGDSVLKDNERILRGIMDNFIDADKIDYLYRDAYFCGLEYGKFDRDTLINSMTVELVNGVPRLVIEQSGVQALENMIFARYYMFNQVYFHPKRRLYDKLFVSYMRRSLNEGKYPNNVKKFLAWDDTRLVQNVFKSREFSINYKLIYDADQSQLEVNNLDRNLGLVVDVAKKSIVDGLDSIYVKDNLTGKVHSVENYSPLLKSLRGKCINKLRIFAPEDKERRARKYLESLDAH
jgi:hypothetical protein